MRRTEPLYQRGGVWWCRVRNRAGRIIRRSTGCKDREAAIVEWKRLEREAVDPAYAGSTEASLLECLGDYYQDLEQRGVSPVTAKIARQKCGHFARIWGDLRMSQVDRKLVWDYVNQRLREDVTRHTVGLELRHLRRLLALAFHLGKFHLDPARVIPPDFKLGHKPKTRAPEPDELQRVMRQLPTRRAAHLAWIAAVGGRLGESFRALRRDVGERLVLVRGSKTEASLRYVPITPLTRGLLAWSLTYAPGTNLLFAPWGNIRRDIKSACLAVGVEPFTPHDLRRSFGTWHRRALLSAGQGDRSASELVSKMLGHTTDKLVQTTYAKLDGAAIGEVAQRLLAGVPDLYQLTASTAVATDSLPQKTADNAEPTGRIGLPTCALRMRGQNEGADRLSIATKAGLRRAKAAAAVGVSVPELYLDVPEASDSGLTSERADADEFFERCSEAVRIALAVIHGQRIPGVTL